VDVFVDVSDDEADGLVVEKHELTKQEEEEGRAQLCYSLRI
jgi:hypothetical protein